MKGVHEMKRALFIEGERSGYGPDQIEDRTMTVGELIDLLSDYDEDTKVFLRNDNGFTYGHISYHSFNEGEYNEDGRVDLYC